MVKITYVTVSCREEFKLTPDSKFGFNMQVPRCCPFCLTLQRGTPVDRKIWSLEGGKHYGTVLYTCNNCDKKYLVNYSLDTAVKSSSLPQFYPVISATYENELLSQISPRFIDLYNQALRAESINDFDLAATGYRDAVECLIKDYAVSELGADIETVSRKSLFSAIGEYLDPDMAKSADVVRILGNDFTHYQRKYPEYDFDILKTYLEYLISLIERQIKIKYPPLERA